VESPQTLLHARNPAGRGARAPARTSDERRLRESPAEAHGQDLVLGRYRLRDQLGAGGFGVVWRAHDELLRRDVALKRVPRTPGADRERSSREALAAARLSHPAIVALYEACASDDAFYLISELVHGQTLARLIAGRGLCDEATLAVGCGLCDALAHAHSRGVIHRDVKPGNVIVPYAFLDTGTGTPAKLTDFGGAWMSGTGALTRTGDVLGTLAYMAPEQADGRDAEEAADLYSLALVLYEALSGCNPVRGSTPAETARRIGRSVPSLSRTRGDLPAELLAALDRALLARPRSRGTLDELGAALASARAALPPPRAGANAESPHEIRTARRARGRKKTEMSSRGALFEHIDWGPDERRERPLLARLGDGSREPAGWRARADGRALQAIQEPQASAASARAGEIVPERADASDASSGRERRAAPRRGLPRGAWLGCAAAVVIWQAASGRAGLALLLLAASLPLFVVPRRSTGGWLLAALAPILGAAGLAGSFPAIAGQLRSWRMRASLGALGYWWLTLAEPLAPTRLWLAAPRGLPPRSVWESSIAHAFDVLTPMLSVGVLLGAGLWATGTLVLPLIARGRSALADASAVAAWSLALVIGARVLDGPLPAGVTHASPRGAVIGALFGAAIALGARALRGPADAV
jgi:serine/threonine protein kinase